MNIRYSVLLAGLVVLVLSFIFFPSVGGALVLASPDELKWSIVDTPSEEGNVVLSPSEINAFALGADEIFYAIDIPQGIVYKSIDGGFTWDDRLTNALNTTGTVLPAWDIAVAPDDPDFIAVVTNDRRKVYASDDGGDNWQDIGVPDLGGLLIADIAISLEYGDGSHDFAIGTRMPDGIVNGDVWVVKLGGFSGWNFQRLNMDVTSVCFSPGYLTDKVILAIASDLNNTYLCTGKRDTTNNTTNWNVTDPSYVKINKAYEVSLGESEIISSDLELPYDYSGSESNNRIVYAAYSSNTICDDVYLIKDALVKRLDVKDGDKVPIASITYEGTCGEGELLAGLVAGKADLAEASIYICSNPRGNYPAWKEPTEPPTGGAFSGYANAQLARVGGDVYCGTSTNYVDSAAAWADMTLPSGPWRGGSLDESAFSRSGDSGDTWNQLSLIDTQMSYLCDYALSLNTKNGETIYDLYLASVGSGLDSVWRSESNTLDKLGQIWQRVLCLDSRGNDIILRLSPVENEQRLFLGVKNTHDARYFYEYGGKWRWESVWDCPNITDIALVSEKMFYILDDNLVYKGVRNEEMWGGIWEWQEDVDTGLSSGYTITVRGEDFVFIGDGSNEGKVAYSYDGGATFALTEAVPEQGKIQVIVDEEFDSNRFIYAISDSDSGKIYRWAIRGSTSWKDLKPRQSGFYALAEKENALYGAYDSGVARTLIPHESNITSGDWDSLTVGLISGTVFRPGSLRAISDGDVDLWAIDNRPYEFSDSEGCIWIYSDTFVLRKPWPTSPPLGERIKCDPCNCEATKFYFQWRELPSAERYELCIALDERFTEILARVDNIAPDDLHTPAWSLPPDLVGFTCGKVYYWKVRVCQSIEGETIHSRWSPPMNFVVETCSSVKGMHVAPILEAPESGSNDVSVSPSFSWTGFPDTTEYEFILARDAGLAQIVVREEVFTSAYQYSGRLDWSTTYFWQASAVEPVPSTPATGTFTVMPQPQPAAPALPKPATPLWMWAVIGVLALLDIVIIVFCFVRR